ncbi:adenosylhomocysteinase [Agromyces sp. Marseille-P2726]|uniref:adenosylhomocysteinase n=1 Tax=Agromyces sp. Marseille-P2726 TaxID=2709132 RepID=UPI00156F4B12|nr:adenosylhomocysteinase [Agromyces sp. Marseille-P2726]
MSALTSSTLADQGAARIRWIRSRMPLLAAARAEFAERRPFAGRSVGMSLHLEPKTAVLLEVLAAGGAEIVATGNHGSTQDDIVAHLRATGMTVFGRRDDTLAEHEANVAAVVAARPGILLDNGADLGAGVGAAGTAGTVIGGTEETTSGGIRLRTELAGRVPFPTIVINDSPLKAIGENRHGVGQSVVESVMRITNLMIPGRRFVVAGYGWCGRGIAQYLRAFGGRVAVAEIDELKAFEAALDGYRVGELADLAEWGEFFITATGQPGIITDEIVDRMPSGAVLANAGHFPWEIDTAALTGRATAVTELDTAIERIELPDGREIVLLAGGRMVNLAGREPKGNSIEAMDLGFLLQALSLERVATAADSLVPGAQPVPDDLEREIARRFVRALGADR